MPLETQNALKEQILQSRFYRNSSFDSCAVCRAIYVPKHRLKRNLMFKNTLMRSLIPRKIKIKTPGEVWGEFLRPLHGTLRAAALKSNKCKTVYFGNKVRMKE